MIGWTNDLQSKIAITLFYSKSQWKYKKKLNNEGYEIMK